MSSNNKITSTKNQEKNTYNKGTDTTADSLDNFPPYSKIELQILRMLAEERANDLIPYEQNDESTE